MADVLKEEFDALANKVSTLEKKLKEIEDEKLGIQVITHTFEETDIQPAFSKENKLSMGVQSVAGYEPKFAILHESGRTGDIVESCYLSGTQINLRLFSNFKSRKATPKVDVVYFKKKF